MTERSRIPPLLWGLVGLGLALRLLGAWFGNLMFDESAHLALSQTIDFHPDRFHLVFRTVGHPLLSVYILKASSMLFGDSNFGIRILHLLMGTATIVSVFALGREAFSERAGLWAAALLSVDQFHASWSRIPMPEIPLMLFWSLALLQALRLSRGATREFVLLGIWIGLACLSKATGVLLFLVLWLFAAFRQRYLLKDKRWYLAHAVALLVMAPDLVWNLLHFSDGYLHRNSAILGERFHLQLTSVALYLGELARLLVDPNVLDVDYDTGNTYAAHWPAGLLYLSAMTATIVQIALSSRQRLRKMDGPTLLAVAFIVPFGLFSIVPGTAMYDPYWWASVGVIAAIVATAGWLDHADSLRRFARPAAIVFIAYLAVQFVPLAVRPGRAQPRLTVAQLAAGALETARNAEAAGDLKFARMRVIYALNVGGPNANAYYQLGRIQHRGSDDEVAVASLERALALEPGHEDAAALLETILQGRKVR